MNEDLVKSFNHYFFVIMSVYFLTRYSSSLTFKLGYCGQEKHLINKWINFSHKPHSKSHCGQKLWGTLLEMEYILSWDTRISSLSSHKSLLQLHILSFPLDDSVVWCWVHAMYLENFVVWFHVGLGTFLHYFKTDTPVSGRVSHHTKINYAQIIVFHIWGIVI